MQREGVGETRSPCPDASSPVYEFLPLLLFFFCRFSCQLSDSWRHTPDPGPSLIITINHTESSREGKPEGTVPRYVGFSLALITHTIPIHTNREDKSSSGLFFFFSSRFRSTHPSTFPPIYPLAFLARLSSSSSALLQILARGSFSISHQQSASSRQIKINA